MRIVRRAALGLIALGVLWGLPAAAEPWRIDQSHAHVTFRVSHLGFSDVHGQFRIFDAEIDFDPEAIEEASVTFTVQADSVETFWARRDEHLRSEDFLDAAAHPEITFVSKAVRLTSADTAEVTGDLTIRGVTREETFEAYLNRIGPSPFDRDVRIAGFRVTGEIDRTAYGSTFGAPAIGAMVAILVEFEISPAAGGGG